MKIELIRQHAHAGKTYPPGETLELPEDTARWLIDAGVARALNTAPQPAPKSDKPNRKE